MLKKPCPKHCWSPDQHHSSPQFLLHQFISSTRYLSFSAIDAWRKLTSISISGIGPSWSKTSMMIPMHLPMISLSVIMRHMSGEWTKHLLGIFFPPETSIWKRWSNFSAPGHCYIWTCHPHLVQSFWTLTRVTHKIIQGIEEFKAKPWLYRALKLCNLWTSYCKR